MMFNLLTFLVFLPIAFGLNASMGADPMDPRRLDTPWKAHLASYVA
jgi:hypothetical protein